MQVIVCWGCTALAMLTTWRHVMSFSGGAGRLLCVLPFLSVVFVPVPALAQESHGSGQKAYGKEISVSAVTRSGDRYETATGRALMTGTLAASAKLFSDVDGLPEWIGNLSAVKEVGARSLTDRTVYMRFSAPAGFSDRDGFMRFSAAMQAQRTIILSFEDIPTFPRQPDAVRMTDVRGKFRVEQIAQDALAVEFQLHYDPSAKPVFLANLGVRQQVKQTLERMRQRIEGSLRDASVDSALARSLGLE